MNERAGLEARLLETDAEVVERSPVGKVVQRLFARLREGADFIKNHLIRTTDKAFDDFASVEKDDNLIRKVLGL